MFDRIDLRKVLTATVVAFIATGCGGDGGGGGDSGGGEMAMENPVDAATAGNIS